jgi:sortase A
VGLKLVRGFGETLITAGVVILLFCAYELWFTNLYTKQEQHHLDQQLHDLWTAPPPAKPLPPIPGGGIAILHIPRLGNDYSKVIVEGVATDDLKKGPGHYPGTALPGQVGNFVVSGHRTTYGAPFNRLDEVKPGDAVVVETRDMWFTYRVQQQEIVSPRAIEVTFPVPGHQGAVPTQRLFTFTTCNPKYSARQRLVLTGGLESALPKSQGRPPALGKG